MAKNGGARPGAGRKKGTPNRLTVEIAGRALADGLSPIEFMLTMMRDENAEMKDRAWAAEKVAPYLHPRPAPVARPIRIQIPPITGPDAVLAAVNAVLAAVGTGEIAPSEAQSLVSIIEAQRKAVETGEILQRLAELEAMVQKRQGA